MNIENLLKTPLTQNSDKIYTYGDDTVSKGFYDEYFDVSETKEYSEKYLKQKAEAAEHSNTQKIMRGILQLMKDNLPHDAVVIEIGGGDSQNRSGRPFEVFRNYYPINLSYPFVARYTQIYNRPGFVGNAESLPFKDNSIDGIFTHTFLEHPIHPEKVLQEIVRVIKPGGVVVHNDAWFCRWWQCYGLKAKDFKKMTLKEQVIHVTSKLTGISVVRIPPIILKRILKYFIPTNKLSYSKLTPNYTLHLGSDEDAASSIDPIDVVRFYEGNGFELLKPMSLKQRLFYPNKYIAVRKKG